MGRAPLPPFDADTAVLKARLAEDAWNTQDAAQVALAYTADSFWRNRAEFVHGHDEIIAFLKRKWAVELEYRLIKEVWAFGGNRIAVRFVYEWRNTEGNWFRSHGNENWAFNEEGLMQTRFASINDESIRPEQRLFYWEGKRRPDDHPGLTALGL